MKTILFFQHSFGETNRDMLAGVREYASNADWRVQTIQYSYAAVVRHNESSPRRLDVPAFLDFWKPQGCIIEGQVEKDDTPKPSDFRKIPVVFLDRMPDSLPRKALCVYSDSGDIANTAARELLSLGLENFAYVAWWKDKAWSRQRGEIFRNTIMAHGKECRWMALSTGDNSPSREFSDKVKALPCPCGVFCANDLTAHRFISEAIRLGRSVPEDFAVIGVDNDIELCEGSAVSITSIPQDCHGAGRSAAKLLDLAINHRPTSQSSVPMALRPVVHRASTRLLPRKDARLSAALEYIRLHACDVDIDIDAVAKAAKCSRRQIDSLFKELVRHSALHEVQSRRVDCAKQLLGRGTLPISEIATKCGYRSASDFSRAFRRESGMSPLQMQRQNAGRNGFIS